MSINCCPSFAKFAQAQSDFSIMLVNVCHRVLSLLHPLTAFLPWLACFLVPSFLSVLTSFLISAGKKIKISIAPSNYCPMESLCHMSSVSFAWIVRCWKLWTLMLLNWKHCKLLHNFTSVLFRAFPAVHDECSLTNPLCKGSLENSWIYTDIKLHTHLLDDFRRQLASLDCI